MIQTLIVLACLYRDIIIKIIIDTWIRCSVNRETVRRSGRKKERGEGAWERERQRESERGVSGRWGSKTGRGHQIFIPESSLSTMGQKVISIKFYSSTYR